MDVDALNRERGSWECRDERKKAQAWLLELVLRDQRDSPNLALVFLFFHVCSAVSGGIITITHTQRHREKSENIRDGFSPRA